MFAPESNALATVRYHAIASRSPSTMADQKRRAVLTPIPLPHSRMAFQNRPPDWASFGSGWPATPIGFNRRYHRPDITDLVGTALMRRIRNSPCVSQSAAMILQGLDFISR